MGNQQPKLLTGVPVVIIVGGGYAGVTVAKALDASGKCNVILIERKQYFLHNIGSLRASVQPGFEKQIMFPYNHLLKNGSVIHAQVTRIETKCIYLYGYENPVKFDYLVVATGSTYPFPGKIDDFSYQGAQDKYQIVQAHMKNAKHIAIIGGGPVGIELAGEIATELPNKSITLIHSQSQLLDAALRSEFRTELQSQLESLHVNVILGQRIDTSQFEIKSNMGASYIIGSHQLTTDKGTVIDADLIFIATGTQTNTHTWKNTLPLARDGRIKVNSYLQVESHSHIYAVGDAASIGRKMAWYAGMHGTHAANNILAQIGGKQVKVYGGDPSASAIVPVGKNGGASQLPIGGGIIVRQTMTKFIKSSHLLVDKYRALLNAPANPSFTESSDISETRIRNVSTIFPQQTSNIMIKGLPVDNTLEMMMEHQQQQ